MYRQPFQPQKRPMRKETCPQCKGRGTTFNNDVFNWGIKTCTACKGTGQIEIPIITERSRSRNTLGI